MLRRSILALTLVVPAFAADRAGKLDALLTRYHELGLFNGSALVAEGGQVILRKGYGDANMEWHIANAPDTRFRLGSITKQFTSALVMQLVQQGKLDLSAPMGRYLPDYPKAVGDRVTIHQLLNHTSGIPGYTELPAFGKTMREPMAAGEFIKIFSGLPLMFEPGTKYSYNNSGYFLLGMILEQVTGLAYERLLHDRIYAPLGMKQSGYDLTAPLVEKRAAGYDKTLDGLVNTSYLDMMQPYAAGSLYSTVDDLLIWNEALFSGKVAATEKMFTPGLGDYGYGWIIHKNPLVIEHGGGINGFNTQLTRDVETKRVYILLNNTGGAPLQAMVKEFRAILEGREAATPKMPAATVLYQTWKSKGISEVLAQWKTMRAGSEYDVREAELVRLAGKILEKGKPADALELAKIANEMAPHSVSVAMLMGAVHGALGHRVEAITAYARAIELSDTPRGLPYLTQSIKDLAVFEVRK